MNTLFDQPRELPHNGTSTSKAAAQVKAANGSSSTDRNRIAAYLHSEPTGATRQQLADILFLNPDSVRPRVRELLDEGFIVETGETRLYAHYEKSKVLVHFTHAKVGAE